MKKQSDKNTRNFGKNRCRILRLPVSITVPFEPFEVAGAGTMPVVM